jgi:hypothetical protein
VVTHRGSATGYKEFALGAFPDIKGTFDRITQAAGRHGIVPAICRWICSMLESKNINTTLSGETLMVSMVRGCLQGGVLSCVLWSPVVVELLCELNAKAILYSRICR